jgi:hypothetical protein
MKFTVSLFDDIFATSIREEQFDLHELAWLISTTSAPSKETLPLLKLARFGPRRSSKGSLRWDQNLVAVTGVELDYDGERLSIDEAINIANKASIACLIYTSPSHRPEAPRWRVLCPFRTELPPDRRTQMVNRVNGLYDGIFARESWSKSQAFYYGCVTGNPAYRVV